MAGPRAALMGAMVEEIAGAIHGADATAVEEDAGIS